MNEEKNLEVVRKGYEHFANGDIEGLLSLFTDDISWKTPEIENAQFAGSRHGRESVAEFFGLLNDAEEFSRFEPLEYIAQDDKVVVLGESASTVKTTGNSYETDWVHIFHLRDGKVAEFHEFFDNAAANRAFRKTSAAEA